MTPTTLGGGIGEVYPSRDPRLGRGGWRFAPRWSAERFRQAPCTVKGVVSPREHIEREAGRRRWHALQGDIGEEPFASGPALFAESLRGFFDRRGDRRIDRLF